MSTEAKTPGIPKGTRASGREYIKSGVSNPLIQ